eukprot:1816159-Pyramimonas_sp.AAC.1
MAKRAASVLSAADLVDGSDMEEKENVNPYLQDLFKLCYVIHRCVRNVQKEVREAKQVATEAKSEAAAARKDASGALK